MNKPTKFLLALLGAVEVVFSVFIPIGISLLFITLFEFGTIHRQFLLIAGILSSFYRAIRTFIN